VARGPAIIRRLAGQAAPRARGRGAGADVPLTAGLGEPLACIIHCQLWLPFAYPSLFASGHPHHHHHAPGMNMGTRPAGAPQKLFENHQDIKTPRRQAMDEGLSPSAPSHTWCPAALLATSQTACQAPAGAARIDQDFPASASTCLIHAAPGGAAPFHVPPSPVHHALPELPLLLVAVALLGVYMSTQADAPSSHSSPPPLRPPIPIAA